MSAYLVAILTSAGFYVVLALALNLQWGLTGMLNFGVAGFYGLGAYTSALSTELLGLPFVLGFLFAVVVGAAAGLAVAALSARLVGDFLAIATLGFAEIVRFVALNEDWLTRGPRGFPIETRPLPDGLDRNLAAIAYLGLVAALVLVAFAIVERLRTAPFGRVLRAIRDDDVVPATLGKNVFAFRLKAFAIGAALIAAAGSLYAHWVQSISPDHFTTALAIGVWMSLIVGGTGNNRGIVLGATMVMVLLEGSRFLTGIVPGLDAERLSALRIVLIGVVIVAMIRFRPQGLLPEPTIRLEPGGVVTQANQESPR